MLGELLYIAAISLALLYFIQFTGKVNLGLKLPGASGPLRKQYRKILRKYFHHYNLLGKDQQREFEKRVQHFINAKNFVPRQGLEMTPLIKALIAASAVQLTLGLPKTSLSYFSHILVYPDDYYSTINKKYHKGEVNPRLRTIVISWKSFLDGYVDKRDGVNLGLHEMAHALHLEHLVIKRPYKYFDSGVWKSWTSQADKEIERIKQGENAFLRSYAATDLHEFFAVSVEYFFEQPKELNKNLPEIYKLLAQLLRQDPLKLSKTT